MLANKDVLTEIFYYIVNYFDAKFTADSIFEKVSSGKLTKYYPKYFVETLIQDGFHAGFIEKDKNEYLLTVRGKSKAHLICKDELDTFAKLIMDVW